MIHVMSILIQKDIGLRLAAAAHSSLIVIIDFSLVSPASHHLDQTCPVQLKAFTLQGDIFIQFPSPTSLHLSTC